MTTTPETEVGSEDAPMTDEPADTQDAFEQMAEEFFPDGDDGDEEVAEGDELEADEVDEEGEPEVEELPDIEPPNSLTAEEKEEFKSLPREAQEILTRRVGALEKGFQSKAQQAANAERTAQHAAAEQLAQIEREYAQQFQQIAQQFQAQRPDPRLLSTDPQAYSQQLFAYEQSEAQRSHAQQQAEAYAQQAAQREQQIERAQQQQEAQILNESFPEYFDQTTGPALQQELTATAKALGYTDELISQARATDILAMREANGWRLKAEKYDALQKGKMAKVRAAKGKPKMATPGAAGGKQRANQAQAAASFEVAKNSQGNQRVDAFADYLDKSGLI